MIRAVVFDFSDVLATSSGANAPLLDYTRTNLSGHYKLAIITNSSGRYIREYLTPQQIKMFDEIIVAADVGMVKPSPEIYLYTAKKLGVRSSECAYIDNHDFRAEGAIKTGMQGIVYKNFDQAKRDLDKLLASYSDN